MSVPSQINFQHKPKNHDIPNQNYGEITLILGCMFAGKSSELIRQIRRYRSVGLHVIVIKHSIDDRYNAACVTSHDKEEIESINVSDLELVLEKHKEEFDKADLVVIEEAQFFHHIYQFVLDTAEKYNKDVIVAGLDGNYKREPFLGGELLRLIPISDNIYKLHGFCQICRRKASFTKAIIAKMDSEVNVGGKEKYIPVCRQHYLE